MGALISAGFLKAAVAQQAKAPNVVMISVDDLNDFIGGMGHPDAITPNLDKLIGKGVLFTNAQCQSPMCSPSRTAIMTGLRPSTTGIYGMIDDNKIREANAATRQNTFLHQYFKDAGYYTMGVGKIFHEHAPEGLLDESGGRAKGFGPKPPKPLHWNEKQTSTDWGAFPEKDEQMPDFQSAQWAIERLKRTYDQPFFLSVGFLRPHVPWHVPQKWFDLYDPEKLHEPPYLKSDREDLPPIALRVDDWPMMPTTDWAIQTGQWKDILQGYLASVSFVDHYVGQVLDALEASPYAKNTIVVLWSDHGYRLGEKGTFAKMCLWERATAAPLIFSGPNIPQNTKIDAPVELFSIYPTLTDLCGLAPNKNLEARSLLPLLKSPKAHWPHPAISTWARNNHAVKTKDYRYIHYEDGSEELYRVKNDPNEWHNVASQPQYAKVKAGLKKHLPTVNVKWAAASEYNMNDYFIEQKKQQSDASPQD
ncbi:choline-sulfatase [Persicitalea jodogahamensis]|uniref:Choline-sulfatase n=1 Tax=Persicitalea jodogahamensis TaxID=402147 RepID=A0A8J3D5S5_9BACT|nr:choline-sulfatase [Persicitalea jodogahamensis]